MKSKTILLFVIFIVSLYGCDTTSPNKDKPGLHAVVRDENGNTIKDVKVYIIYDIPAEAEPIPNDGYYKQDEPVDVPVRYELTHNFPNPFNNYTTVYFALPEESTVNLELLEYGSNNVIYTVIEGETLNAGYYSITLPAQTNNGPLNNGLYKIQAKIFRNGESVFNDYVLSCKLNVDFNEINKMDPAEISDRNGEFSITYDSIPFGTQIVRTTSLGPEPVGLMNIPQSVKVLLMNDAFLTLVRTITFAPEDINYEEFIMRNN